MEYPFDPELQSIATALPTLDLSDIDAARARMVQVRASVPPFELPETIALERRTIPGPSGAPEVEILVMTPLAKEIAAGVIVWMHGGGFVLGDIDGDVSVPAGIAAGAGAVVVSVGYRLAPEHPYPAALDDCWAALSWVAEHVDELGGDAGRIGVGGVSAGAALAAALTLRARDHRGPQLCLQVLDIPVLDDRLATPSMHAFTDTPLWTRQNAEYSWAAYLGPTPPDPVPPTAAPARAVDLSGLPPAYITTCEFDPLRDEGIEYASRLIQAGVSTELHHYPGTFHGSSGAGANAAVSRRMVADRTAAIARGLQPRA